MKDLVLINKNFAFARTVQRGVTHVLSRQSQFTMCGMDIESVDALVPERKVGLPTVCKRCVKSLYTYREGWRVEQS